MFEVVLNLACQLYRAAQDIPADNFEDIALTALGAHLHFDAAVWFAGKLGGGKFQFHRLHTHRLAPGALEEIIEVNRRFPWPMQVTAASPGIPLVFQASELYAAAGSAALEYARRWDIERQLLVARDEGGEASGEWLSLHRSQGQKPFTERDKALVQHLMPHLSEARAVNCALSLRRASMDPYLAPGSHRTPRLLDGAVLHSGRHSVPLAERLSRREYEVAQLFGAGCEYKQIAQRCGLSPATVRNIVQKCYRKLGINNKAQLVRLVWGELR